MKKLLIVLLITLIPLTNVVAMSYKEAREQARFLTDKMAYELNLNDAQYNDAYEINLDYLMGINTADDVYGKYLTYRNADLRHILYDWQYALFTAADYFFHPVYWRAGAWVFPIYTHYHIGHFYYDHPRVFWEYRGAHGRAHHRKKSFYANRRPVWHSGFRGESRRPVTHPGNTGHQPPSGHFRPGQHPNRPNTGIRPGQPSRPEHQRPNPNAGHRHPNSPSTRPHQTDKGQRPNYSGNHRPDKVNHSNNRNNYRRQSSTRTTVSGNIPSRPSRQSAGQQHVARGRRDRR